MTRAKFTLARKTETMGDMYELEFQPVTTGSEENKVFFKWTPYGNIKIGTVNKAVAEGFEVGKDYYVDFTLAE